MAIEDNHGLEVLVVGAYRNGTTLPNWDIYKHNGLLWFSVTDLRDHLGLDIPVLDADTLQIDTPIGLATIPRQQGNTFSGKLHLSGRSLQQFLHIQSELRLAEFAVYFLVPWGSNDTTSKTPNNSPTVDYKAPSGSVSFIQLNGDSHRSLIKDSENTNLGLTVGGNAVGGTWFASVENYGKEELKFSEVFWNKSYRNSVHRVGTNYTDLSYLLDNFSYTGLQSAWTNDRIKNFTDIDLNDEVNSFVSNNLSTTRSIVRHDGPPAGVAILNIDGRTASIVRVDLNGTYVFTDINYQTRTHHSIEIQLFNDSISEAPSKTIDISRSSGESTLGKKQIFIKGGIGKSRNTPEQHNKADTNSYIHFRYGLTDRVTIGFATQSIEEQKPSLLAGFNASIGKYWALNLDLASKQNKTAFELGFLGESPSWRSELTATGFQDGFNTQDSSSGNDIMFLGSWRVSEGIAPTLNARSYTNGANKKINYTLPGISGKYDNNWRYYISPDHQGLYGFGLEYSGKPKHKTTITHHETQGSSLFHSYNRSQSQTWLLGTRYSPYSMDDTTIFAHFNLHQLHYAGSNFQIAVSRSRKNTLGVLNWHKTLPSGLKFQLQYERLKDFEINDKTLENLWVRTKMTFHKVDRKFVPAQSNTIFFDRGGIAVTIVDEDGSPLPLNEIGLKVNGKTHFEKSRKGKINVSRMSPGIYTLELDEQNLPIEYNSSNVGATVEVNTAATTSVELQVTARYGISGTLKDKRGRPMGNKLLTLYDDTGSQLEETVTDKYGFYRLDGLSPGLYQIEQKLVQGPRTEVLITNDYVFDQDIVSEN